MKVQVTCLSSHWRFGAIYVAAFSCNIVFVDYIVGICCLFLVGFSVSGCKIQGRESIIVGYFELLIFVADKNNFLHFDIIIVCNARTMTDSSRNEYM